MFFEQNLSILCLPEFNSKGRSVVLGTRYTEEESGTFLRVLKCEGIEWPTPKLTKPATPLLGSCPPTLQKSPWKENAVCSMRPLASMWSSLALPWPTKSVFRQPSPLGMNGIFRNSCGFTDPYSLEFPSPFRYSFFPCTCRSSTNAHWIRLKTSSGDHHGKLCAL